MPSAADFAYLDWPGPIAFAHRGGASEVPENTLPAFEHAVRLGYTYVETDVHATADGVLLAFHDDVLDRVTDRTGVVADLPYAAVREARVDGVEPIPLFADLLAAFPRIRVNIDPKHDAAVDPLVAALRAAGPDAVERVCIGAFDDLRIERVRQLLPGICTSLGPMGTLRLGALSRGLDDPQDGAPMAAPCAQVPPSYGTNEIVTEAFVETAHRLGVAVHVWTIDDPAEMVRLLDLGVDGLMTDRPAALKEVLERRGQWVGPPTDPGAAPRG